MECLAFYSTGLFLMDIRQYLVRMRQASFWESAQIAVV